MFLSKLTIVVVSTICILMGVVFTPKALQSQSAQPSQATKQGTRQGSSRSPESQRSDETRTVELQGPVTDEHNQSLHYENLQSDWWSRITDLLTAIFTLCVGPDLRSSPPA